MYKHGEVHSKEFLKVSGLPTAFQITSLSVTKSKGKERKQTSDARLCHRELSGFKWAFFFSILLISLNFTTVQIKALPHAMYPKQSSDF